MRIVVLGAGTVGTWVADLLCQRRHRVTVVDSNPQHAQRINEELDVRGFTGLAANASTLFQADVAGADVCISVTGSDETNIVAASLAKAMGARRSIARVYAPIIRDRSTFDYQRHFRIDRLLSLERLAAIELAQGIRSADTLSAENLAEGRIHVNELTIEHESPNLDKPLKDLKLSSEVRIGTILREGKMWIAGAGDRIQIGDRITLFGLRGELSNVKKAFQKKAEPKQSIIIAGGGETGFHLAQLLSDKRYSITVVENEPVRCEFLANHLKYATVIQADATRRTVMEEERFGTADVFAACTGDDENNIMACVEAKELGTKTILAIVGRPDYANVVGKLGINLAVSPRDVMANQILSFLNKGPVISRSFLEGGNIGLYEVEVEAGCRATEFNLLDLPLPTKCLIMAVIRHDYVLIPGADDQLKDGDNVIVLVNEDVADELLALFEVKTR